MQTMTSVRLLISLLTGLILVTTSCGSERLFKDNKTVKVYQTLPIIPHGSDSYRLVIGGKSYRDVYAGLYLEIPEKKLICFRTEPNIGANYLHVVPLGSDVKEFKVKLDNNSSFGHSFGMDTNDVYSTYVDKIEGDKIFFTEHFWKRGQNRYCLNLKLHTLVEVEKGERNGPADKDAEP